MLFYVILNDADVSTVEAPSARHAALTAMRTYRLKAAASIEVILLATWRGIEYLDVAIRHGEITVGQSRKYTLVKRYAS